MKKYVAVIVFVCIAILLVIGIPILQRGNYATESKYLLIRHMDGGIGAKGNYHKASLITDEDLIQELYFLSETSIRNNHACWFHWQIDFWQSPAQKEEDYFINEECGGYSHKFTQYFTSIKNNPTHTIYEIVLPVTIGSTQAVIDIQELDLWPFLFYGPYPDLPTISISKEMEFKADSYDEAVELGIKELLPIVKKITDEFDVIYQSEYECSQKWWYGQIDTCKIEITMKFSLSTNLMDVTSLLEGLDIDYDNVKTPHEYIVQVVAGESDLETMRETIMNNLDYVEGVYYFGNTE
jgi:hypothetical protein